jgi:hypothetical protein
MQDEKIVEGAAAIHEHSEHDEITPTPDDVPAAHLDLDKETAEYVGTVAAHIDPALNKKLFWTVNRRILACMLGVSAIHRNTIRRTVAHYGRPISVSPWTRARSDSVRLWASRKMRTLWGTIIHG